MTLSDLAKYSMTRRARDLSATAELLVINNYDDDNDDDDDDDG